MGEIRDLLLWNEGNLYSIIFFRGFSFFIFLEFTLILLFYYLVYFIINIIYICTKNSYILI